MSIEILCSVPFSDEEMDEIAGLAKELGINVHDLLHKAVESFVKKNNPARA